MSAFNIQPLTVDSHNYELITVDDRVIVRDIDGNESVAVLDPSHEYYLTVHGAIHKSQFPNVYELGRWLASCSAEV